MAFDAIGKYMDQIQIVTKFLQANEVTCT